MDPRLTELLRDRAEEGRTPDEPVGAPTQPMTAPTAVAGAVPERRLFYIVGVLAIAAVVASLIANWIWSPEYLTRDIFSGRQGANQHGGVYQPSVNAAALPKSPKTMLPTDITAYETIDSHYVPGKEQQAAEAVYNTYNVNVGLVAKTSVYANVQGYGSEAEAQAALDAVMAKYPAQPKRFVAGFGVVGRSGFDQYPQPVAWTVAWQRGQYVTYVKTFFQDAAVSNNVGPRFLVLNGTPVVKAVAAYQVVGKQGSAANVLIYKGKKVPGLDMPKSGIRGYNPGNEGKKK